MKTLTHISRNSLPRIPRRSQSQFVKGNQMTDRGGTRTVFEFFSIMITTYCRLETKTKAKTEKLQNKKINTRIFGPIVALRSVGLDGAEG